MLAAVLDALRRQRDRVALEIDFRAPQVAKLVAPLAGEK